MVARLLQGSLSGLKQAGPGDGLLAEAGPDPVHGPVGPDQLIITVIAEQSGLPALGRAGMGEIDPQQP